VLTEPGEEVAIPFSRSKKREQEPRHHKASDVREGPENLTFGSPEKETAQTALRGWETELRKGSGGEESDRKSNTGMRTKTSG